MTSIPPEAVTAGAEALSQTGIRDEIRNGDWAAYSQAQASLVLAAAAPHLQRQTNREQMIRAVALKVANVGNLPDWMQYRALGRDLRPLAEIAVDAILAEFPAPSVREEQQQ